MYENIAYGASVIWALLGVTAGITHANYGAASWAREAAGWTALAWYNAKA